jgi:hypothetical protein
MTKNMIASWGGSAVRWWTNVVFPPRAGGMHYNSDQREAAARYTRGNIAIQAGSFITKEELEASRTEVSKIVFPK